jgi:predicted DNA-binding transcriptional regulator YafY
VIIQKHNLNDRQTRVLDYLLEHDTITIQNYEKLCPEASPRTLQRDLKSMLQLDLLTLEGATNQLVYKLVTF